MQFIQARHYTATPGRQLDLIVLHDMEAPDKPSTAEDVAAWFAGPTAPEASAHYCVDSDSVVQCVRDQDVAWHAPGANHNGLGVEQAGYKDNVSEPVIHVAASLVAQLAARYRIPLVYVDAAGLLAGERGVTTHLQVTLAFRKGDHTDPGMAFPVQHLLDLAKNTAAPPTAKLEPAMHFVTAAPIVDIAVTPSGKRLVLDELGHVYAPDGGYHGGYWDLDPRARQGTRTFSHFDKVTDAGYRLVSCFEEDYDFATVAA